MTPCHATRATRTRGSTSATYPGPIFRMPLLNVIPISAIAMANATDVTLTKIHPGYYAWTVRGKSSPADAGFADRLNAATKRQIKARDRNFKAAWERRKQKRRQSFPGLHLQGKLTFPCLLRSENPFPFQAGHYVEGLPPFQFLNLRDSTSNFPAGSGGIFLSGFFALRAADDPQFIRSRTIPPNPACCNLLVLHRTPGINRLYTQN